MKPTAPNVIVMMGVMGSGKTYIGERLARYIGYGFFECDEAHSSENVEKMRAGIPLTDADRIPWLNTLASNIVDWHQRGTQIVMTCPAHKRAYRDILRVAPLQFVHLHPSRAQLESWISSRTHEYMNPDLLDSQLAILEAPTADEGVITLANDTSASSMVNEIIDELSQRYTLACPLPTHIRQAQVM